jgi:hypothetical protein
MAYYGGWYDSCIWAGADRRVSIEEFKSIFW